MIAVLAAKLPAHEAILTFLLARKAGVSLTAYADLSAWAVGIYFHQLKIFF